MIEEESDFEEDSPKNMRIKKRLQKKNRKVFLFIFLSFLFLLGP